MIGPIFNSGSSGSEYINLLEDGEGKGDQKLTDFQGTSATAISFNTIEDFERGDLCLIWVEANNDGGSSDCTLKLYRDESGSDLLYESPPLEDDFWHVQLLVPTKEYDAIWAKWDVAPTGNANLWVQAVIKVPQV